MIDMLSFHNNFKINAKWKSRYGGTELFGTLQYRDECLILECFGSFEKIDFLELFTRDYTNDSAALEIIDGVGQKTIRLYDLRFLNGNFNPDCQMITYLCAEMFVGIHFDKYTQKVSAIKFSFSDKWSWQINLNLSTSILNQDRPIKQSSILIQINESIQLRITQWVGHSFNDGDISLKRNEYFEITSKTDILLEEIVEYQRSFNHFLQLCTNIPIYPLSIEIKNEEDYIQYCPDWLLTQKKIVFERKFNRNNTIFHNEIQEILEDILKKWFPFWLKNRDIMFTFFGLTNSTSTLENQFGTYVDVLQRFYESEYGKKELSVKLDYYFNLCPDSDSIRDRIISDNFSKKVLNTRTYNVHGIPHDPKYVVKGGPSYYLLIKKLKTLIDFFLIEYLVMNSTQKEKLMKKCFHRNMTYRHI